MISYEFEYRLRLRVGHLIIEREYRRRHNHYIHIGNQDDILASIPTGKLDWMILNFPQPPQIPVSQLFENAPFPVFTRGILEGCIDPFRRDNSLPIHEAVFDVQIPEPRHIPRRHIHRTASEVVSLGVLIPETDGNPQRLENMGFHKVQCAHSRRFRDDSG